MTENPYKVIFCFEEMIDFMLLTALTKALWETFRFYFNINFMSEGNSYFTQVFAYLSKICSTTCPNA